MKVALVKTEKGLLPAYDSDEVLYKKIGLGEVREYEVKKNRNLKHHRKFFALLRLTIECLPEEKKEEALTYQFRFVDETSVLKYIKLKLGYYSEIMTFKKGVTAVELDSICFEKMGQDEFEDFYNRALDVILKLLGADKEFIETNLVGFM